MKKQLSPQTFFFQYEKLSFHFSLNSVDIGHFIAFKRKTAPVP